MLGQESRAMLDSQHATYYIKDRACPLSVMHSDQHTAGKLIMIAAGKGTAVGGTRGGVCPLAARPE